MMPEKDGSQSGNELMSTQSVSLAYQGSCPENQPLAAEPLMRSVQCATLQLLTAALRQAGTHLPPDVQQPLRAPWLWIHVAGTWPEERLGELCHEGDAQDEEVGRAVGHRAAQRKAGLEDRRAHRSSQRTARGRRAPLGEQARI